MSVEISVEPKGIEEFQAKMEKLGQYMQRDVHRALDKIGMQMKYDAIRMAPVKTGRLRQSIYYRVVEWLLKLGATVHYAFFQEFGTRHFPGRFFLTEAVNLNLPQLVRLINWAIAMAIKAAAAEERWA